MLSEAKPVNGVNMPTKKELKECQDAKASLNERIAKLRGWYQGMRTAITGDDELYWYPPKERRLDRSYTLLTTPPDYHTWAEAGPLLVELMGNGFKLTRQRGFTGQRARIVFGFHNAVVLFSDWHFDLETAILEAICRGYAAMKSEANPASEESAKEG